MINHIYCIAAVFVVPCVVKVLLHLCYVVFLCFFMKDAIVQPWQRCVYCLNAIYYIRQSLFNKRKSMQFLSDSLRRLLPFSLCVEVFDQISEMILSLVRN